MQIELRLSAMVRLLAKHGYHQGVQGVILDAIKFVALGRERLNMEFGSAEIEATVTELSEELMIVLGDNDGAILTELLGRYRAAPGTFADSFREIIPWG